MTVKLAQKLKAPIVEMKTATTFDEIRANVRQIGAGQNAWQGHVGEQEARRFTTGLQHRCRSLRAGAGNDIHFAFFQQNGRELAFDHSVFHYKRDRF